jgi:hypothetical protein
MPIATRLTNTGTLLVNGNFDEISLDAGSISFSGAQSLSPPSNNALQQLTDPFTVEAWIYPTVVGGVQNSLWSTRTPDVQDAGWDMFIDTNGKLVWGTRNVRYITGTTTLTVNTWSHAALVRSSTTSATLYLNGVSQGTATVSGTQNFTNNTLTVGGGYTGGLTNFRLVKGVAVYSGAFTPPQSILSAVTGTSLLLNVINSTNFITDGSPNNFTVTNNGTATWNATGPFNQGSTTLRHRLVNPASVSGSTVEITNEFDELTLDAGAISFNGTDQYLTVPTSSFLTASNTYTIEFWMYPTSFPTGVQSTPLYQLSNTTGTNFGYLAIGLKAAGVLTFAVRPNTGGTEVPITSSSNVTLNAWNHVAASVNGGAATFYINGTSVGTATVVTMNGTQTFSSIGYWNNGFTSNVVYYNGYLSNFRIVKATAVYTAAFTPSESILPAVNGTSLLLNVTDINNLITDSSPNNLTLTNNGTAVYTVTSPFNDTITVPSLYGSGSLSFNGTNQYLTLATNAAFQMGTGDLTVEAWIFVTSTAAADKKIFSLWGSNAAEAYSFHLRSNNRLIWQIYTQNSPDVAALAIQPNTWTHVAWSKSGTTCYLFINGVLEDTTTGVTNSANGTAVPNIGRQPLGAQHYFPGYITNLRVVKGTALYTSDFPIPTAPLTAVSGTSLLLNVSSSSAYITDSSTNNFTVTNNNAVAYSGTVTPLPGVPRSRQLNDGTLQVTTAFDEFTGAPVVDTSLQLWLDSGQTASYPGSGTTWTDLSGQSNTGTLNNSPTFSPTVGGGTFLFNGTNQTATTVSLNLQQNFTLEAWVNQNVLNGFAIFGQGTQTTNNGLHIWYTTATTIRFGMYGNDTDFTVSTSTGIWYHMIFTYNHSSPYTKGFYLNAVVRAGSNVSGPAAYTGSGTFRLGATYSTAGNYGNGYFEGVKMYNRILTADEVTTNFNALRGRYGI